MRTFLFLLMALIATIGVSVAARAQTVSSKIMETRIDWTPSGGGDDGMLNVFLTDTIGLAGLTVVYGSSDTAADYFSANYSAISNFVAAGGAIQDATLTIPIGHFTEIMTGYLRISVLLSNGGKNVIDVEK